MTLQNTMVNYGLHLISNKLLMAFHVFCLVVGTAGVYYLGDFNPISFAKMIGLGIAIGFAYGVLGGVLIAMDKLAIHTALWINNVLGLVIGLGLTYWFALTPAPAVVFTVVLIACMTLVVWSTTRVPLRDEWAL